LLSPRDVLWAQADKRWLKYMLKGVELTSTETIETIHKLRELMVDYQERMKTQLPKLYSLDLLNTLFKHPYTKIEFVVRDVGVQRAAAARYLDALTNAGFLVKQKLWRNSYYINQPLFELLQGK
jgi:Fic family protein